MTCLSAFQALLRRPVVNTPAETLKENVCVTGSRVSVCELTKAWPVVAFSQVRKLVDEHCIEHPLRHSL